MEHVRSPSGQIKKIIELLAAPTERKVSCMRKPSSVDVIIAELTLILMILIIRAFCL